MNQSCSVLEGQDIITTNPSKRLLDYANVAMEIEQEVFDILCIWKLWQEDAEWPELALAFGFNSSKGT